MNVRHFEGIVRAMNSKIFHSLQAIRKMYHRSQLIRTIYILSMSVTKETSSSSSNGCGKYS